MMITPLDNNIGHCLQFVLEQVRLFDGKGPRAAEWKPLLVGVNGCQGAGKTTLVFELAKRLRAHGLPTAVLSIDDFYLAHDDQAQLASEHPTNPLIQHRGQPSTHDLPLALSVLSALQRGFEARVPYYDKSAFSGQGDRAPAECWSTLNGKAQERVEVVLFEGWCVGFRALRDEDLGNIWQSAFQQRNDKSYRGRLGRSNLDDIIFINNALRSYDQITNQLDVFIHIDAEDPLYVYDWRLEQEASLRSTKGSGMTDKQVMDFVNGCGIKPLLSCIVEANLTRLPVVRALYRPDKVGYIRRKYREAAETYRGKESAGQRNIENLKSYLSIGRIDRPCI